MKAQPLGEAYAARIKTAIHQAGNEIEELGIEQIELLGRIAESIAVATITGEDSEAESLHVNAILANLQSAYQGFVVREGWNIFFDVMNISRDFVLAVLKL